GPPGRDHRAREGAQTPGRLPRYGAPFRRGLRLPGANVREVSQGAGQSRRPVAREGGSPERLEEGPGQPGGPPRPHRPRADRAGRLPPDRPRRGVREGAENPGDAEREGREGPRLGRGERGNASRPVVTRTKRAVADG